MPIDEIAGGLFKFIGRLVLQFILEVVIELLVRGPGGLLAYFFLKNKPDIDGWVPIVFGLLFWFIVGVLGYIAFTTIGSNQNA